MLSSRYYSASRVGIDSKRGTALIIDNEEDLYSGFNDVAPALDTRALRDDEVFQEALKTANIGRKLPSRMGTSLIRQGTVRLESSRVGTAGGARPMTGVRAAGYTSTARSTPSFEEKKEESVEDRIKQLELKIMALVEESCMLSSRMDSEDDTSAKTEYDLGKALSKAQEASALERQLIRMQDQANLGDLHNLDLTFAVLCNLAGQYALNEMYTEALNTYQLLTRNKLFPHANRLKVNMGNIYFKMGEHPKALKLYRMALDQTPTAEKDLRMKVMHNIGLLLVRMGKFRDAITNFQHIMQEQGDYQTGLYLVLCSVALDDAEGGKAAFHAMLDVEPPNFHKEITVEDENDARESVLVDVLRLDRLAQWSRKSALTAERCLALAAAALLNTSQADVDNKMSWCIEALRGYDASGSGSGAGARLELSAALASLRSQGMRLSAGQKALQRLKAVAKAHPNDRIVRAEANADAAFVAYALGNTSEALSLASLSSNEDPYSCSARVTSAVALKGNGALAPLATATRLNAADMVALHDYALALEEIGGDSLEGAAARWAQIRNSPNGGPTLKSFASAGLARFHQNIGDANTAEHWYNTISSWDPGVTSALAQLYNEIGDIQTAKHHYQDLEAAWPCDLSALEWLGTEARGSEPASALQYYRRAARLQPNNPQWGLMIGSCLRSSGKYQEALALYKKLNARFPDNVSCLKLLVKLCGDQGLSETASWNRELQRAQARIIQQERASAGSHSSGNSQSPIDQNKGSRVQSGNRVSSSRSLISTGSSGKSGQGNYNGKLTRNDSNQSEGNRSLNRSFEKSETIKKRIEEFDDDLPLPPE